MKVIVDYSDGRKEIAYEGDAVATAMRVQAQWVAKAKKDTEISSMYFE